MTHFGLETLDIIEHQIHRLVEVKGIAKKRITMIQRAWEAQKLLKKVMVFYRGHGVSTLCGENFQAVWDGAIATVTQNPYQLAGTIFTAIGSLLLIKIADHFRRFLWTQI
ncbi:hypothetical protein AB0758_45620 [Tolypothrix bouteillei VB521301_2]|uniref:hypothetical protein n=1 Tax=Tolypothrix bouteillei TaxID=1246981 RepID=UPI0038B4E46F